MFHSQIQTLKFSLVIVPLCTVKRSKNSLTTYNDIVKVSHLCSSPPHYNSSIFTFSKFVKTLIMPDPFVSTNKIRLNQDFDRYSSHWVEQDDFFPAKTMVQNITANHNYTSCLREPWTHMRNSWFKHILFTRKGLGYATLPSLDEE